MATVELLCLKNAGAQISMFFTSNELSPPMAIKTIKILGAVLELPSKQHCQSSSPFTTKMIAPKQPPGFFFSVAMGAKRTFILAEINCQLSVTK